MCHPNFTQIPHGFSMVKMSILPDLEVGQVGLAPVTEAGGK